LTAQFVHRLIAYFIVIYAGVFALAIWQRPALRLPATALCAAILAQIALGVATVVYGVPLAIALAHQANAMMVLALALWTIRRTLGARAIKAMQ
ncbi:MAG: COX15/CtaA family protein, partial [Rhodomicrobium sp.]